MFDLADILIASLSLIFAVASYLLATRRARTDAATLTADWRRDVRQWADAAIGILAELESSDPRIPDDAQPMCRIRLSALIDTGRLLFPNVSSSGVNANNPPAYRGYRHRVLDPLVAVMKLFDRKLDLYPFQSAGSAVRALRREFVSMVSSVIDPSVGSRSVALALRDAHEFGGVEQASGKKSEAFGLGARAALILAWTRNQQWKPEDDIPSAGAPKPTRLPGGEETRRAG